MLRQENRNETEIMSWMSLLLGRSDKSQVDAYHFWKHLRSKVEWLGWVLDKNDACGVF